MTIIKSNITKGVAAGAVAVVLSGFVPGVSRSARAATLPIQVQGSFTAGIQLTAGTNLQFGPLVATSATGNLTLGPAGGTAGTGGFFNATPTVGTFSAKFGKGAGKAIKITVGGLGTNIITGTVGGASTGTVDLKRITLSGPITAPKQILTTDVDVVATLNGTLTTTETVNMGGRLEWTGQRPIGTFNQAITLTIGY